MLLRVHIAVYKGVYIWFIYSEFTIVFSLQICRLALLELLCMWIPFSKNYLHAPRLLVLPLEVVLAIHINFLVWALLTVAIYEYTECS